MSTKSDLVVKANVLIPSLSLLGLNELRLLSLCISKIDREADTFITLRVPARELAETFDLPEDQIYHLIDSLTDRILSKPVRYEESTEGVFYKVKASWFKFIKYSPGNGYFIFKMTEDLKPYLLQLRDNFTSYRIRDVYQFKSASSWHVYEVLKQYKAMKTKTFDIDQFKALVGVTSKYDRFNNFKYKLLEPSLEDINTYSDIKVQCEYLKTGVRITSLKFHIIENDKNKTTIERAKARLSKVNVLHLPSLSKILRNEYRVNPRQAKDIANLTFTNSNEDSILSMLPDIKARWEKLPKPKKNLGAYVFASLRDHLTGVTLL